MNLSLNAQGTRVYVTGKPAWESLTEFNVEHGVVSVIGNIPVNIDAIIEANQWPDSKVSSFVDFSSKVSGLVSYWKLEAQVGASFVTLPMQYFRATMWTYRAALPDGGTNYVELSVPNASQYASVINSADSFRVKRFFVLPSGTTFDYVFFYFGNYDEQQLELQYLNGLNENFCIIKSAFRLPEELDADQYATRVLTGIRSNSSTADGVRVTCNFDPNILPGMTVDFDGDQFVAQTISYNVSPTDQYIEVYSYSL